MNNRSENVRRLSKKAVQKAWETLQTEEKKAWDAYVKATKAYQEAINERAGHPLTQRAARQAFNNQENAYDNYRKLMSR